MTRREWNCLICGQPTDVELGHRAGVRLFNCRRCGNFTTPAPGGFGVPEAAERALLSYLSAYTRQIWERDRNPAHITEENWRDLAEGMKAVNVPQRAKKLLELFAKRTSHGGALADFNRDTDPPVVGAVDDVEINYLLNCLIQSGWVDLVNDHQVRITMKGWEHLTAHGAGGIPDQSFVAMAFHADLTPAYDRGIRPAVMENCRLPEPIRIDRTEHNEKICDKIIADIGKCQFVIADFTLQRGGVYFEAGYALGLGRPVIWCCRADDFANLHFDTRQYNHIKWETPEDLRRQLADRIQATILRGERLPNA